jgi:hypothetical protein
MSDPIYTAFLERQYRQGMELAAETDLLDLFPIMDGHSPPCRFVAAFHCVTLVRQDDGTVSETTDSAVGIYFPPNYLRCVEPQQIVTMLAPTNIFLPNVRWPTICLGHISPGSTELVDLLYQTFEILTGRNWSSQDALDPMAAAWARNNQDHLPTDRRPLKRRKLGLVISNASTP